MFLLDRHRQQQFGSNWSLYIEGFQRHRHEVVVANQTDDIHQTLASELLKDAKFAVHTRDYERCMFLTVVHKQYRFL